MANPPEHRSNMHAGKMDRSSANLLSRSRLSLKPGKFLPYSLHSSPYQSPYRLAKPYSLPGLATYRRDSPARPPSRNIKSSTGSRKVLLEPQIRLGVGRKVGRIGKTQKEQSQDTYFDQCLGPCRLVGVCDGHGPLGHLVSAFLAEQLPKALFRKVVHKDVESLKAALVQAYSECAKMLKATTFDTTASGSTCVSVLITNTDLICANVGDCRAVVGRNIGGIWGLYQLSWDHKPDLPTEHRRIQSYGGEVSAPRLGPARVFHKNKPFPGLSVSRALGDDIAASAGVIAVPDVQAIRLADWDRFMIVASDGLWNVVNSMEAVSLVQPMLDQGVERAAEGLVDEAERRWQQRTRGVDDITALVVLLQ